MIDPESTTFVQRVVVSCLLQADDDRLPVDAAEIRTTSRDRLEQADDQPIGGLSEADVARALNELVDAGVLEERRPADSSPVGKGRPRYALAADPGDLRAALADTDVASLLE
jgi:hypothetical protein